MLATSPPFSLYTDTDGSPLEDGFVYFGTAGGNPETSPITVYYDSAGTQPAAQPLRTSGGYLLRSGSPALVYSTTDYSVTVRNKKGELVYYAATSADFNTASQAQASVTALSTNLADKADPLKGGGLVGFNPALSYALQTIGAALLTLPSLNCFTNVDPTGTADCTAAINTAIGLTSVFVPGGSTYKISGPITVGSNRVVQGAGSSSLFRSQSGDISQFTVTGASGAQIRDIGIQAVNPGTTLTVGAIVLDSSSKCLVQGVTFTGMSNDGVRIRGASSYNTVRGCVMTGWQNTTINQDASDVKIMSVTGLAAPSYNVVTENVLLGGGEHGVIVMDPYTLPAVLPSNNKIFGNEIGQHTGYGVAVYMPNQTANFTASQAGTVLTVTAITGGALAVGQFVSTVGGTQMSQIVSLGTGVGGVGTYNMSLSQAVGSQAMSSSLAANSSNLVMGNSVHDIQGSFATNRDSGAGIYVVGAGACGTEVVANQVRNCCVQTLTASLAPAGIGVSGIPLGALAVLVSGNTVTDMPQFHGIVVAGGATYGNCLVTANTVTMPNSAASGAGIYNNGQSNVSITNNKVAHLYLGGSQNCILIFANGQNISNVFVDGNDLTGGGQYVQVTQTGGCTVGGLSISGNKGNGCGVLGNAGIHLTNGVVTDAVLSGNKISANTVPALLAAACLNTKLVGNTLKSTGATSVQLSGACTGSYFDLSNDFGTLSQMNDTSTGFFKEVLVAAVPAAGTWAKPARFVNTASTVGQPKAWQLTTSGTLPPGTGAVTSEGNL